MRSAFRIASAAFALATIVALPFYQSAHAGGYADVAVEPSNPAYQTFGNVFTGGPGQPVDQSAHVRAYFKVTNYGGSNSGSILVVPSCSYESNHQTKNYAAKPAYAISSLTSGASTLVWFECPRHANLEGMPVGAMLSVRGNNEPGELMKDNSASMSFSYIKP